MGRGGPAVLADGEQIGAVRSGTAGAAAIRASRCRASAPDRYARARAHPATCASTTAAGSGASSPSRVAEIESWMRSQFMYG